MSTADSAPKFKYKFVSSNKQLYNIFFEEENDSNEFKIRP